MLRLVFNYTGVYDRCCPDEKLPVAIVLKWKFVFRFHCNFIKRQLAQNNLGSIHISCTAEEKERKYNLHFSFGDGLDDDDRPQQ